MDHVHGAKKFGLLQNSFDRSRADQRGVLLDGVQSKCRT